MKTILETGKVRVHEGTPRAGAAGTGAPNLRPFIKMSRMGHTDSQGRMFLSSAAKQARPGSTRRCRCWLSRPDDRAHLSYKEKPQQFPFQNAVN